MQRLVAGVLIAVCLTMNFAAVARADEELKSDVPKMDTNVLKPKVLKGGVQHAESFNVPPKQKLSGNAKDSQGRSKFKLFSAHAKSDKNRNLQAQTQNNTLSSAVQSGVGIIGVKFVLAFGRPPVINRVFPGTPAADMGLRNDDVIVAVDGVPTLGLSKEEVYQMIVGTPGTPVTVTVSRNGDFLPRTMNRMDLNDISDPSVRRDYMMSM
jgi:C-terminal processing protease CtpA/Prc